MNGFRSTASLSRASCLFLHLRTRTHWQVCKFEFWIKLNITLPSHLTCEHTTISNCSQLLSWLDFSGIGSYIGLPGIRTILVNLVSPLYLVFVIPNNQIPMQILDWSTFKNVVQSQIKPLVSQLQTKYVSYSHTVAMQGIHLVQLGFECLDQGYFKPPQVSTNWQNLLLPDTCLSSLSHSHTVFSNVLLPHITLVFFY